MNNIRPVTLMQGLIKNYPKLGRQIDSYRQDRANKILSWPNWCFLPMAGWYAIVSDRFGGRVTAEHGHEISRLAAMATWRYSQGIYQLDPDLFDALADTSFKGDLPTEVFYRLPEWCVYVATPGLPWPTDIIYGFWAHLEYDVDDERAELRLLFDCDTAMQTGIVHLGPWTISEGITRAMDMAMLNYPGKVDRDEVLQSIERASKALEPIISILLYLCSAEPEIGDRQPGAAPSYAKATKTKQGWRLFPPDKPKYLQVGQSIGQQLRRSEPSGKPGQAKKAHLRRGHWHGYWVGPKTNQRFEYRWLHPLIVGGGD